jgi:ElaB/YqjD/DUF883 family membrane-anchored ribosome-binding protein
MPVNEPASGSDQSAAKAVEERIEMAKESAGGRYERVRERVSEAADSMKQKAQALREKIRETEWEDVTENVKGYVRNNPGKSLAIALGVGFVLGLLLRRRDDD